MTFNGIIALILRFFRRIR